MDPIEKRELKRKAWMRLAAQRRRAGLLRGRVVVLSLLCFAILWGAVFTQMITGNDPVLAGKEAAATRTVASAKKAVETTEPRELKPRRARHEEGAGDDETEVEAEPETERSVTTEVEALETAEVEAAEAEEAAAAELEEPLVTSQS